MAAVILKEQVPESLVSRSTHHALQKSALFGDRGIHGIDKLESILRAFHIRKGVFLGLENHHGIVSEADDILDIVRSVKSPWFGINLDTGNFYTDDPYGDLARCAPYAVNVQVKVDVRRRGAKQGEPADLNRLAKILRDANYQGYVALEYEAPQDPWQAVPVWLKKMKEAFAV